MLGMKIRERGVVPNDKLRPLYSWKFQKNLISDPEQLWRVLQGFPRLVNFEKWPILFKTCAYLLGGPD